MLQTPQYKSIMRREQLLAQLERSEDIWDVVVIGGGATGLGIALDSVTRGYRTLLFERGDFAEGTSSRSTKLIHGGVRYLRQGHFPLIKKAVLERARLLKNAPHLVHLLPFVIPAKNRLELFYYQMGIKLYEWLAGNRLDRSSYTLSREELKGICPTLQCDGLAGGVVYFDAQFDDARLAIEIAQTIVDQGGTPLNYMSVDRLLKEQGKVVGVIARDVESDIEYEIHAKAVVNAAGIFSDSIRRLDDPGVRPSLTYSQGAHLVLPRRFLPTDHAVLVPKTPDGRVIFLIPWHERVLVGTTETPLDRPAAQPEATSGELTYLLETAARYLIEPPDESDILSHFAGIRPLVRPSADWLASSWISRDHRIVVSRGGLISVLGGKWTTYRQMAEEAVNAVAKIAQLPPRACQTQDLRIHDTDKASVDLLSAGNSALQQRLHPNLPCREVDILWAIRNEMARTVDDILARRTPCLFLDLKASRVIRPKVAKIVEQELGTKKKSQPKYLTFLNHENEQ